MNLADSRMDCLRGYLATLSVLVVRIALLEYSKIHEKAYKCIVCEFGGFQNVLRDACVLAIPTVGDKRMTADEMRLILQSFFDNCTDYYKM